MSSRAPWAEFENVVARLQRTFSQGATIKQNEKIVGRRTGRKRQIDISIRTKVGSEEVLIIVECKRLNRKCDVKEVEAFIGLKQDVGAPMAIMVSTKGFSRAAYKRAKDEAISLYRYEDTQQQKWPTGLETSALLEIWEVTPRWASFVLADVTEEPITTEEGLDFHDLKTGAKTGFAQVTRDLWNSLPPEEQYDREWTCELPTGTPQRPEIKKLKLGATSKFIRGFKKGRLNFEGLVDDHAGSAQVAGWTMIFDGPLVALAKGKALPPSRTLSILVKSVFIQTLDLRSQLLHRTILNGALTLSVAGTKVMRLPVAPAQTSRRSASPVSTAKPA
jgi:hypothetical protein